MGTPFVAGGGAAIADIPWPPGSPSPLWCGISTKEVIRVRDDGRQSGGGHVVIAHGETVIESGDHVIVFCLNKRLVRKSKIVPGRPGLLLRGRRAPLLPVYSTSWG